MLDGEVWGSNLAFSSNVVLPLPSHRVVGRNEKIHTRKKKREGENRSRVLKMCAHRGVHGSGVTFAKFCEQFHLCQGIIRSLPQLAFFRISDQSLSFDINKS